jgi:hypothetical protein
MRCPRTEGPGGWRAVLEKVLELAWRFALASLKACSYKEFDRPGSVWSLVVSLMLRFALASLKACSYKEFEILLRVGEQGI